jgi:hypothetical protein
MLSTDLGGEDGPNVSGSGLHGEAPELGREPV